MFPRTTNPQNQPSTYPASPESQASAEMSSSGRPGTAKALAPAACENGGAPGPTASPAHAIRSVRHSPAAAAMSPSGVAATAASRDEKPRSTVAVSNSGVGLKGRGMFF
jgi:hypothetical protein